MQEYFEIGQIVNTFGIKGMVKVVPYTDDITRFDNLKKVYVEIKNNKKNYEIEEAKNLGIEQLQDELNNEIENKEKIVNKIINTYEKEDGVEVYVTYEVLEDIGTNEKIVF